MSMQIDGSQWCQEVEKEDYIPCKFLEELMEPLEWMHCLITLDANVPRPGPKFCDEEGYDIHPFNMISVVSFVEGESKPISNLLLDEVSVEDVPIEPASSGKENGRPNLESSNEEEWEVPEGELHKVKLLLKHREAVNISITPNRSRRWFCQIHQKRR